MPNFAATVGFSRAIEALVKALPFGMVNECHEVGKLGHEVGCVEGR